MIFRDVCVRGSYLVSDLGVKLACYGDRLIGLCHLFRLVIEPPMNDRAALVRIFLLLLKILPDSVKAFFHTVESAHGCVQQIALRRHSIRAFTAVRPGAITQKKAPADGRKRMRRTRADITTTSAADRTYCGPRPGW